MIEIPFIFAKKCDKCKSMRQSINSVSSFYFVEIDLLEYDCETPEAIDVALEYGIEDIPGCSINGNVICGDEYDPELIVKAFEELSEKS